MSRSIVFCVILVLISAVTSIPRVSNNFERTIIVDINPEIQNTLQLQDSLGWKNIFGFQDISEIKDTSELTELFSSSQLSAVPSAEVGGVIRYTIGKRISNDRLVAHGADSKRWSVPMDVTLALKYPTSGQGAIITYVEIDVNQSSSSGRAQVIGGGIGQRSIAIVVLAQHTLWLNYTASIYGI